ncbi:MAG: hypothetical protein QOI98_3556, partial [Solirubrobacteraceae bacterium]|nr:hypothetical protein [Solirubrobacteraceae bacterium]
MFYLRYIAAELRRRRGRTVLTALGLGVGVGLVVAVSALSKGLDDAQNKVLEPLTGVGTDMSVTRPLKIGSNGGGFTGPPGGALSNSERKSLRRENGGPRFGLRNLAKPGQHFSNTDFVTTQLTFPETDVDGVRKLPGASDVSGGLTLSVVDVSGRVPKNAPTNQSQRAVPGGPGVQIQGPRSVKFDQKTVSGVDAGTPTLAAVTPSQITRGRWFADDATHQAVLSAAYARRKSLGVGDKVTIKDTRFKVVGIAKTPLGGQPSDIYVK